MDLEVEPSDPRVVKFQSCIGSRNDRVQRVDLGVRLRDPEVTSADPRVEHMDPGVALLDPRVDPPAAQLPPQGGAQSRSMHRLPQHC